MNSGRLIQRALQVLLCLALIPVYFLFFSVAFEAARQNSWGLFLAFGGMIPYLLLLPPVFIWARPKTQWLAVFPLGIALWQMGQMVFSGATGPFPVYFTLAFMMSGLPCLILAPVHYFAFKTAQ